MTQRLTMPIVSANRLTAFVVKSFSQAADFITIDENVVQKAVTWLVSQQNENGTFREPGRVLHKEMQVRYLRCPAY